MWEVSKPKSNSLHPTMKPLELVGKAISNSSKIGEIVLDLFGGSGSTLIASDQLDRICYTMELDERYTDVIVKRYAQSKENIDDCYLIREGKNYKLSELEIIKEEREKGLISV